MTPDEWDDPKLWDVPDRDVRWPAERCPGSGRLPTGVQGDDRSQWWACPVCGRPVDVVQHVDEGGIPTEFLLVKEHTR